MKLLLNEIEAECIIGDLPEERVATQILKVDVELEISELAGETDELEDTVDYAALTEEIRASLVKGKCRMLERAAKLVIETCLKFGRGKVFSARASVTKTGAIAHLKSASVIVEGSVE